MEQHQSCLPGGHHLAAPAVRSTIGGSREGAEGAAAAGSVLIRRHHRRIHPWLPPMPPSMPDLPREGGEMASELLASEYHRCILQDHVFALQEDLRGDGIVDLASNSREKKKAGDDVVDRPATMWWIDRHR
uniref:Uncharacterized protein n=1 Tax=Oryza barthii TaxID=65489 RepID=A0A0D3GHV2_9ORYZ